MTKWSLLFPKRSVPRGCVPCDEQSRPLTEPSGAPFYIHLAAKDRTVINTDGIQLRSWCSGCTGTHGTHDASRELAPQSLHDQLGLDTLITIIVVFYKKRETMTPKRYTNLDAPNTTTMVCSRCTGGKLTDLSGRPWHSFGEVAHVKECAELRRPCPVRH